MSTTTIRVEYFSDHPKTRDLLGVNAGPLSNAPGDNSGSAAYTEMGVTSVRTHDLYPPGPIMPFDMDNLYAATAGEKQACLDLVERYLTAMAAGYLELYLRIGYSFPGDKQAVNPPDFTDPQVRAAWIAAALELVTFCQETLARLGGRPLQYIEFYNEPNLYNTDVDFWVFWIRDQKAEKARETFFTLFCEFWDAMRDLDPSVAVGCPGFTLKAIDTPLIGGSPEKRWAKDFIDRVEKRRKDAPSFAPAFISFHCYNALDGSLTEQVEYYKDKLHRAGLDDVSLHLTEWNVDYTKSEIRNTGTGAAILGAIWIRMQILGLERAFYFRGQDHWGPGGYGLAFNNAEDGQALKATGEAFALCAEFRRYALGGKLFRGTDLPEDIWVLGAKNVAGYAVLVANTSNRDHDVQICRPDGSVVPEDEATFRMVEGPGTLDRIHRPMWPFTVPCGALLLMRQAA